MSEERTCKPLPRLSREQVLAAIESDDTDVLIHAALSTATNDPDWKVAQELCIRLSDHPHATVRGNAILAIGYVARSHQKPEKRLVKPILPRARRDPELDVRDRAEYAIAAVNRTMRGRIGNKRRHKVTP